MFGSEDEAEIQKIPLSNNTNRRRVHDMLEDIENNVGEKIKVSNGFCLKLTNPLTQVVNIIWLDLFVLLIMIIL